MPEVNVLFLADAAASVLGTPGAAVDHGLFGPGPAGVALDQNADGAAGQVFDAELLAVQQILDAIAAGAPASAEIDIDIQTFKTEHSLEPDTPNVSRGPVLPGQHLLATGVYTGARTEGPGVASLNVALAGAVDFFDSVDAFVKWSEFFGQFGGFAKVYRLI